MIPPHDRHDAIDKALLSKAIEKKNQRMASMFAPFEATIMEAVRQGVMIKDIAEALREEKKIKANYNTLKEFIARRKPERATRAKAKPSERSEPEPKATHEPTPPEPTARRRFGPEDRSKKKKEKKENDPEWDEISEMVDKMKG